MLYIHVHLPQQYHLTQLCSSVAKGGMSSSEGLPHSGTVVRAQKFEMKGKVKQLEFSLLFGAVTFGFFNEDIFSIHE